MRLVLKMSKLFFLNENGDKESNFFWLMGKSLSETKKNLAYGKINRQWKSAWYGC